MTRDDIVEYVKARIASGTLRPGQRVVEAKLCRELNAGRAGVREALKQLAHEEFIELIPYRGAVVKEISQKDIAQIYDIMGALEGLALRVATPHITETQIASAEKIIDQMESNKHRAAKTFQLNLQFHEFLTRLGGNDRLLAMVNQIKDHADANRMGLQGFYNSEQFTMSIAEHRAILAAVKERKPEKVEKLVRKHYMDARDRLIKYACGTL
jgi:DNA-binding GntR family transcriptional regulator